MKNKNILTLLFLLISTISFAHFGTKGPYAGYVACSYVDDTTLYLGAVDGGVFVSNNKSLTSFRARPVGLTSGKMSAISKFASVICAATVDSGLFKFTGYVGSDRYWQRVSINLPSKKMTSLLGVNNSTFLIGTADDGIYMTTDSAVTWVKNTSIHHDDIRGLYLLGSRIIALTDGGLFSSDDNGLTWTVFSDVANEHVAAMLATYDQINDVLFVKNENGFWKISNASSTTSPSYMAVSLPSGFEITSISVSGSKLFIGSNTGIEQSDVTSISWSSYNTGLPNLTILHLVAFQSNICAAIENKGLYVSSNSLSNFSSKNNGFNNLKTYSMVVSGTTLLVQATENGIYVSNDLGASYALRNNGLTDSLHVNDLAFYNTKLYAVTENRGVFISADSGKSWATFNVNLPNIPITKIYSFKNYLYVLTNDDRIFRNPYSSSWTEFTSGLSPDKITSLLWTGSQIVATTNGYGVFVSPESSASWVQKNSNLSNLVVTSSCVVGKRIFIGTDGSGVFVADSVNFNWNQSSPLAISHTTLIGLDATKVQAMNYFNGYVYASYRGGLVASSDFGNTWIPGGNQFNLPSYTNVNKIGFVTTRVFVTTDNNAIYSNALSELPVINAPDTVLINSIQKSILINRIQLYPNPAQEVLHISTDLYLNSTYIIRNVFGQKIHSETKAGFDTIRIENLTKGLYYLEVYFGSESLSIPFVKN